MFNFNNKQKMLEDITNPTCLIFNTACFGDLLITNTLVQNIKQINKTAKIVYVVDKKFYDVAKYQKDVDDVIIFDKNNEHKGLFGIYNFIKNFPYKNIDFSFVIYGNERNILISKLLKCKKVLYREKKYLTTVPIEHINLLKKITKKEVFEIPIKYEYEKELNENFKFLSNKQYIVLCTTTKREDKDLKIEDSAEFVKQINKINKYNVVFVGVGEKAEVHSRKLKENGCDFIDLTNKTTIRELATIIHNSEALVSADTGTMHLGYAIGTQTLCVYYKEFDIKYWSPNPDVYNNVKVIDNSNPLYMLKSLSEILNNK